ncbi:MAG TPA: hypothetical protein VJ550_03825 [Geomonas sp.]|nr:hypothetical protein [Geomonas sp.]
MKMRAIWASLMMTVLCCGSVWAWGLPSIADAVKSATGGGRATGNPDAFLAKAKKSEELVNKSAEQLFCLIASKEEQAKAEEIQKKIDATTDSGEKMALQQEKNSTVLAGVCKASADENLKAEARKWDDKKKKAAVDSLFNLALGGKMAASLVPEGQALVKSIQANPLLLTKIGSLVEAIKSLGGIGVGTAKVISAVPPVFSAAKIDVKLPSSSTETPKDIEI